MLPGETADGVKEELLAVIGEIAGKTSEVGVEVTMRPGFWDPYQISEGVPEVQTLVRSVRKTLGRPPEIRGKAACTDGSHLYHLGKIPTVLFGPGDETLSHKPDEYVSLRNLVLSVQVLHSFFSDFFQ